MERILFVYPFHCPLRFFFDHINVLHCIEQEQFLILVLNVCINQKGVSLGMNVFYRNLETVKRTGLRDLYFSRKVLCEIFHYNTITCCEECQNIFYEVFFIGIKLFPIPQVLNKVDLICSPERSQMFFVMLKNWWVLNWKKNKPVGIFSEHRLLHVRSCEDVFKTFWVVHGNSLSSDCFGK